MKKIRNTIRIHVPITLFCLLIAHFMPRAYSQPIKIGDDLSHLVFRNVQHYPADSLRLTDHMGKLIILDFWSVSCGPCIAYMPVMHELQETFGDALQVILVTSDDQERVATAAARNERIRDIRLPSVLSAGELAKRFPFFTLPSHVWIDQKGIVKYIANGTYATEKNIKAFLDGRDLMLPLKSELKDLDTSTPLWIEGNGRHISNLQAYSYLMGRIDVGLGGYGIRRDKETGIVNHIRTLNQSLKTLIQIAYGEGSASTNPFWRDSRIIYEVKNCEPFERPTDPFEEEKWRARHTYCYELRVPVSKADRLYEIMRQDLYNYLGVNAEIVELEKDIYKLVLRDSSLLQGDKVSRPKAFKTSKEDGTTLHLTNMPIERLVEELMYDFKGPDILLVDKLPELKTVTLNWKLGEMPVRELRSRLNEIGIDLLKTREKIPMLRIFD